MGGVEGVLEAAAVACPPPGGGPDQLHLFLVLRPGAAAGLPPTQLRARCQAAISTKLNPLFKVRQGFELGIVLLSKPWLPASNRSSATLLLGPHTCMKVSDSAFPSFIPTRWSVFCCAPRCRAPPATR